MALTDFEISTLWANTVMVQPLADHAPHTARMCELVDRGLGETMFDADEPAVDWLKANVIHGIGAMLRDAGFTRAPEIAVGVRLQVQQQGDFLPMCNQPGDYITGLYVLRAPSGETALGSRDDRRPGCISFYDPRIGMNMNAIRKDPYVLYHHTVAFQPGLLLLWPAYVPYFLHPHLAAEPALRVAIDVRVSAGAGT